MGNKKVIVKLSFIFETNPRGWRLHDAEENVGRFFFFAKYIIGKCTCVFGPIDKKKQTSPWPRTPNQRPMYLVSSRLSLQ